MPKPFFIYLSVFLGSLAISLDFASVDLALPSLERDYDLNLDQVQWVINGYVIAFAVLMVTGGRFADAYGRKRIFLLGMAIFGLSSLVGGMAWSGGSIIAFRVLQGVGAALMWPAMIGLACAAVGEKNRGFALGLVMGTCSIGNAAGPVVGGALTLWLSWRWVLWINVPMAALAMLITALTVPRDPPVEGPRPQNDFLGMAILTVGLVALMVVAYQVQTWGWSSGKTLGLLALAVLLLGTFPWVERRVPEALVPPALMRNPEFLTLCLSAMVICELFFVVLLYFTQYAMKFRGDNPMWAGACVVPFMLSYGVVSYAGGPLYARFGARRLLAWGLGATIIAGVLLAAGGMNGEGWIYNGALILLGLGVGAVIPTISTRAIETVGVAHASLASGVTFMCQLSGAALLLAVTTALFTYGTNRTLHEQLALNGLTLSPVQAQKVDALLAGGKTLHTFVKEPDLNPSTLLTSVTVAYQSGLQLALWASTGLVVFTLLLVLRFVPPRATTIAASNAPP